MYRSPNIVRVIKSRRLRLAGHVAGMEEGRSAFKIVTGKYSGNRPLERPRRRWEDNIRMDLEELRINAGNWVDSAQDRGYWKALVNAALNEPPGSISYVLIIFTKYIIEGFKTRVALFFFVKAQFLCVIPGLYFHKLKFNDPGLLRFY